MFFEKRPMHKHRVRQSLKTKKVVQKLTSLDNYLSLLN